jgi:hypothetical protein
MTRLNSYEIRDGDANNSCRMDVQIPNRDE